MSNKFFSEIKKNFGFGCMRLPVKNDQVDYEELCRMVDTFIENGFNYFDVARVYHGGKCEDALRECLVKRHPRDAYIFVDKLTNSLFTTEEEILPLFEKQLETAGLEYFDFYLLHSMNASFYEKYKRLGAFEKAFELKKQGKIKHVGISFHDKAEVLDRILTEYPEIECVQIQFNYVDYDNTAIQSGKCYDVCVKHGKPVIVMEPVKGGSLANLPEKAAKVLEELNGGSAASYAIRFAASFDNIMMVLSGMSTLEQVQDNVSFMKDFKPIDKTEKAALEKVCEIFAEQKMIPCTGCKYCVDGCPMNIAIPDLFADYNSSKENNAFNSSWYYMIHTQKGGKASDCVKCGACEDICPQHLKIRDLLDDVASSFEQK